MKPTTQRFFFYLAYLLTMMVMLAATYFIWKLDFFPMLKLLVLLPLIYISVLLTLSLDERSPSGKLS